MFELSLPKSEFRGKAMVLHQYANKFNLVSVAIAANQLLYIYTSAALINLTTVYSTFTYGTEIPLNNWS